MIRGTPTRREYAGRRKVLTTYPAGLFHGTCVTRVSSTEIILSSAIIISNKLKLAQNAYTHARTDRVYVGLLDLTCISLPVLLLPILHDVLAR